MKSAILLCLAATLASAAGGQRYIFGRSDFAVPPYPSVIAAGDFNNDGHLDLAVGIQQSPNYAVSILLGNAGGTFQGEHKFAVLGQPASIAVGDFNGDGNLDLAVGNDVVGSVSILLGNGDGTFKPQQSYNTGEFPSSIAVGDFNGDGKLDLAVANSGGFAIALLAGNGDGTFQAGKQISAGSGPISLVAGDFNHDGALDLFVLGDEGTYSVLLNKGGGKFGVTTVSAPIVNPIKAVGVDLNHDGNLDIVMIGQDQSTPVRVAVLLGDRRGMFQTGAAYQTDYFTIDLVAADFNRDGEADVAVALEDGTLNVYYGDGHGNLSAPFVDGWGGVGDFTMASGDFTGGGNQDLAVASEFSGTMLVAALLNKGDGTFINGTNFPSGNAPAAIATADFNSDGIPDLAIANFCGASPNCITNGSLSILFGNGDGTYQPPVNYAAGGEPTGVAIADFNNDGIPDIAVSNFCQSIPGCANPGTVSVYLGKAGGSFADPVFYNAQVGPNGIAAGDFNGDGHVDLAVINGCGVDDSCNRGSVLILTGNGDGTFTPGATLVTGKIPKGIVAADFNRDGKLDLAVSNNGGINPAATMSLFLGHGDGTFSAAKTSATALSPAGMAVADLNGDGNLDLAIACGVSGFPSAAYVSVLLGNGHGGFDAHVDYPTSLFPGRGVAIADFDADGVLDLAVSTAGAVSVLRGKGDGTFGPSADYPQTASSPDNVGGIVAGDWNADGGVDLATVNGGIPGKAFILMNPPAAAVSPSKLEFRPEPVGTSSHTRRVTFTNDSGAMLHIAGVAIQGAAAGDFVVSSTCPTALSPGMACVIDVTFTPTARGRRGASLSIVSNGLGSPQVVALAGAGT